MKELSIKEKAERYDEAIKVAKGNYETIVQMDNDCTFAKEGIVNTFHHIFPELKESGDERIMKELICFLETEIPQCNARDKYIAWLEKQSKASKVEQALREVEEKADAFTEAHKGETSDEILAQMRGEQKPAWKPSEEQMDALHYVTNFDYGGHKATLVSLYEQLKKLRGE